MSGGPHLRLILYPGTQQRLPAQVGGCLCDGSITCWPLPPAGRQCLQGGALPIVPASQGPGWSVSPELGHVDPGLRRGRGRGHHPGTSPVFQAHVWLPIPWLLSRERRWNRALVLSPRYRLLFLPPRKERCPVGCGAGEAELPRVGAVLIRKRETRRGTRGVPWVDTPLCPSNQGAGGVCIGV